MNYQQLSPLTKIALEKAGDITCTLQQSLENLISLFDSEDSYLLTIRDYLSLIIEDPKEYLSFYNYQVEIDIPLFTAAVSDLYNYILKILNLSSDNRSIAAITDS